MFLKQRRIEPLRAPRLQLVSDAGRAMGSVPNDREAKLLDLLEAFVAIDLERLTAPEIWKLRTIQAMSRQRIAGYTR